MRQKFFTYDEIAERFDAELRAEWYSELFDKFKRDEKNNYALALARYVSNDYVKVLGGADDQYRERTDDETFLTDWESVQARLVELSEYWGPGDIAMYPEEFKDDMEELLVDVRSRRV